MLFLSVVDVVPAQYSQMIYYLIILFLLDDYTAVNRINYDYTFGDNDQFEDDDDADAEEMASNSAEEMYRNSQHKSLFTDIQMVNNVPNMSHMPESDDSTETIDDDGPEHALFKRHTRTNIDDGRAKRQSTPPTIAVKYQWFRNDQLLRNDLNGKEFHVYANGTLRIGYTTNANGQYRCMASAYGLGRVLSKSCHVRQASKLLFLYFCIHL